MNNKWILDEKKIAHPTTANEWGTWFQHANRTVAVDSIDDLYISTVFLGVNHQWHEYGKPLLFETMIFPDCHYCDRYETWDEAVEGHQRAIEWVKNGCKDD